MSDLVFILAGCLSLASVLLIIVIVIKGWSSGKQPENESRTASTRINAEAAYSVPGSELIPPRPGLTARNVRAQRNVRSRMRTAATSRQESDEDGDYDPLADEIALPDGKIGAKKRKKLEMKADKRLAREREIEDREERKKRQEALDNERKKEEENEKLLEAQKEVEEKRLKEEQEAREHEEYMKMKEAFAVEEEGFEETTNETENQNKFQDFINYINNEKIVLLEELAAHFKLKSQDCIDRVQTLIEEEQLLGVIDDRGKFISITQEELEAVARFIRQRGRVPITELVESSNQLIRLNTQTSAVA